MYRLSFVLCATLLAACGSSDTPVGAAVDSTVEQPPVTLPGTPVERLAVGDNYCEGKVAGYSIDVQETVFVVGDFDLTTRTPTLVVVQSDTKGICKHLQAGTLPKGATLYPLALIQQDGKPVQAPRTYSAPNPDDPATDTHFTVAQFRKLDGACGISPAPEDGVGTAGQVILETLEEVANDDGTKRFVRATGQYGLMVGGQGDIVRGAFDATFCDAPAVFEDAQSLMNPQTDAAHCL